MSLYINTAKILNTKYFVAFTRFHKFKLSEILFFHEICHILEKYTILAIANINKFSKMVVLMLSFKIQVKLQVKLIET